MLTYRDKVINEMNLREVEIRYLNRYAHALNCRPEVLHHLIEELITELHKMLGDIK